VKEMGYNFLKGTGVALVTPFNYEGKVDFGALKRLIDYVIEGKVNYLVVQGTTGEPSTMTREEKSHVFEFVREKVNYRVPLVAGIGGNNTRELVTTVQNFDYSGFAAVLSASPYYNRPTQEGIFQHYKALAENSPLPVIIYNVPARTASNVLGETTLRLAHEVKNIAGIKEASGLFDQFSEILAGRPAGFMVISGDDSTALPMIAMGADGLISVAANALPLILSRMVFNALKGDFALARLDHHQLRIILSLIFREGNPAGVKSLLYSIGICDPFVRLPLVAASETLARDLAVFKELVSSVSSLS